ncbi:MULTISPECIES: hypothetical protein [Rhizobium]|uniref:Uncharacterized protein n=1 Tax=Rhizobium leguminosarum TaxID=384 RepID=A0ABD7PQM9_RHILE|nr:MULTISPECIES: hypothetical protein [Rhizobium]MBY5812042.1 hypothetical protein [Rhizobium leguminosarum]NEI65920.1 hypothetical protein [Rhizobium leguminosarum]TAW21234.1 hypothetical protein ELI20_08415 [Rhizobium ruizarguesonis]TAW29399.1 hypothetical protein ELI19_07775 [Rhizobium leguminosarum]TAW43127.1 hypothetical protein ELI18_07715 [Rhizobium leguminosarum]
MSNELTETIKERVTEHYQDSGAGLLLLSDLGSELTALKIWPSPTEKRSLREIVEAVEGISVRNDGAFIAVMPKGLEQHADDVIAQRRELTFLKSLPRALLLAFTIVPKKGEVVSVRIGEKLVYETGPTHSEGMTPVDEDLRIPGLDVSDPSLAHERLKTLDQNIRTWCTRHAIDPADLVHSRPRILSKKQTSVSLTAAHGNALERLYAAQDPEVARKLSVPIDIALVLSRMP